MMTRAFSRRLMGCVLLVVLALQASGQIQARGVEAVGVTVSDLDRAVEFYTRVLHFHKLFEKEVAGEELEKAKGVFGARARVARLQLGDEQLEVTEYLAPQGRPVPVDSKSNDLWFQHVAIIVRDMDQAYAWLRENKVRHASSGPQKLPEWNKNVAGIQAFYFRDPDGHNLEILSFPPDKGAAKWHRGGDDLFMGIDHTAIAISDTERSLGFYRDLLGLKVVGGTENSGTEQEHLNNVFGARLRITALRGETGPGVEFLEYLAPRTGRAAPEDLAANDLAHWETLVGVTDAKAAWHGALKGRARLVSAAPQKTFEREEFSVKDPDGHVVTLVSAKAER